MKLLILILILLLTSCVGMYPVRQSTPYQGLKTRTVLNTNTGEIETYYYLNTGKYPGLGGYMDSKGNLYYDLSAY